MNDDHECNGICLWAADIGVPEAGDVVAYPHPECPEHGEPSWVTVSQMAPIVIDEPDVADQGTLVVPDGLDFGQPTPVWPVSAMSRLIKSFVNLGPGLIEAARSMNRVLWVFERECTCPTPTHRMSCGEGATPKVVVK